jgi:DNA topoisomerase-1
LLAFAIGVTLGWFKEKFKVERDPKVDAVRADQLFTEPPPRYSEATLVKKLEELGIGRPSTYASTLTTLRDREYVRVDKNRFYPEDKGRLVTAFLEQFFSKWVEYDFTAALETQLDEVSAGDLDWKTLLRRFWQDFHAATQAAGELRTTAILDHLNEALGPHIFPDKGDGSNPRECPVCHEGQLSLKTSRFGAFIGCSRYPECKYTRPVASPDAAEGGAESGDRELGVDPATGQPVHLKIGRFGPYVETTPPDADKPKRSSLPKGWSPASIDLEKALRLLADFLYNVERNMLGISKGMDLGNMDAVDKMNAKHIVENAGHAFREAMFSVQSGVNAARPIFHIMAASARMTARHQPMTKQIAV